MDHGLRLALATSEAFIGALAGFGRGALDLVHLLDVEEHHGRARLASLRQLDEAATSVSPRPDFDRRVPLASVEVVVTGVRIRDEPAALAAREEETRALLRPVGCVRDRAERRVADVEPEVPLLRAAGESLSSTFRPVSSACSTCVESTRFRISFAIGSSAVAVAPTQSDIVETGKLTPARSKIFFSRVSGS